jgi:hypothetical protein
MSRSGTLEFEESEGDDFHGAENFGFLFGGRGVKKRLDAESIEGSGEQAGDDLSREFWPHSKFFNAFHELVDKETAVNFEHFGQGLFDGGVMDRLGHCTCNHSDFIGIITTCCPKFEQRATNAVNGSRFGVPGLGHAFADAGEALFDGAQQEILFAGEVVVDEAFADAGVFGDVADAGGEEALLGEGLDGGVDHLLATDFAFLVAAFLGHFVWSTSFFTGYGKEEEWGRWKCPRLIFRCCYLKRTAVVVGGQKVGQGKKSTPS